MFQRIFTLKAIALLYQKYCKVRKASTHRDEFKLTQIRGLDLVEG